MCELAFFGMHDVVVVVFLFHSSAAHLHNVTSIHLDYAVAYALLLFFVPADEEREDSTDKLVKL